MYVISAFVYSVHVSTISLLQYDRNTPHISVFLQNLLRSSPSNQSFYRLRFVVNFKRFDDVDCAGIRAYELSGGDEIKQPCAVFVCQMMGDKLSNCSSDQPERFNIL